MVVVIKDWNARTLEGVLGMGSFPGHELAAEVADGLFVAVSFDEMWFWMG